MSYMKLNNHHIRENGKKRNLFDKVNEIREKINVVVPEIDGEKMLSILCHIRSDFENKYYYGRRGTTNIKLEIC